MNSLIGFRRSYEVVFQKGMNSPVRALNRISRSFLRLLLGCGAAALLAPGLSVLSGCASGSPESDVQVGPITFTDIDGNPQKTAPTALTSGQGTYVDVTLTDDPQLLGANWFVYCGSALAPGAPLPPGQTEDESCGTFTPGHTISGPIPSYVTSASGYVALYTAPAAAPKNGTVTLYAYSTSNPTKYSSVTLNIDGLPISVGFAPAPPASMQSGASAQFRVVLNNDSANGGVNWTVACGSSSCGSFDPTQTASGEATTYIAPSTMPTGGTVQVTATSVTDPTKAATATITIL